MKISEIYVTVQLVNGDLQLATVTNEIVKKILYPIGSSRIGVVLIDTKRHLGIEKQAIPILKKLFSESGCDGDGFGDIDWYKMNDGKFTFGWLGPNTVQWNPKTFKEADRSAHAAFQEGEYQTLDSTSLRLINTKAKIERKKKKKIQPVKTEMISWRGGEMEFVCKDSEESKKATQPPWYVVEVSGGVWKDHYWYSWIDYHGPPKVFLTRRFASEHAKSMRKQYKCQARVVPIGPISKEKK